MSDFLVALDHFRFSRDGGTLVVESERSPGFEETYDWKNEYEEYNRDDLQSVLHDKYYIQLKQTYSEFQS